MPVQSQWKVEIPDAHLATLLFQSPTQPLSQKDKCFIDAARPQSHHFTKHEFRLWSQRFAAGLRSLGIQTGDRVLFFSGNNIFFPVVYMGIIMAGAIFTSANPSYVARELAFQLKDSGATCLICHEDFLDTGNKAAALAGLGSDRRFVFNDKLLKDSAAGMDIERTHPHWRYWGDLVASEEEGRKFHWDDLSTQELSNRTLAINYSSGTTGVPKGVEISHKNTIANILQYNYLFSLYPDHKERIARARWLCTLPMYHAMAQNMYVGIALMRRIPVYIMERFNLSKFLENIQRHKITDLSLVPPIVVMMAKSPITKQYDLSTVENILCGAAPLGKEVSQEAEGLWPDGKVNIKQGWGMTETTSIILAWNPTEICDSACVGELVPNCEAKIMSDDEVTELGRHQPGELWVRGPNVMKGYWRNTKATEQTKTKDGWLKSGDIAYYDESSKFFVVDRKKELIKVKGNQVAPAELESLLLDHPAIADAAVIGVSVDNDERPRAYVVLKPDAIAAPEEIARFLDGKVAPVKRITGGVAFLDAIPKNPSGKILRNLLRDRAKSEIARAAKL